MKKLILGAAMLIGFSHFSNAQQVAPAKPVGKAKLVKEVAVTPQKKQATGAPVVAKAPVKATEVVAAKTTNAPVVLKKDGTPDKRFKAAAPTVNGPLKKDGSADLRFKANKKSKS